jgi:hypothetical protein
MNGIAAMPHYMPKPDSPSSKTKLPTDQSTDFQPIGTPIFVRLIHSYFQSSFSVVYRTNWLPQMKDRILDSLGHTVYSIRLD